MTFVFQFIPLFLLRSSILYSFCTYNSLNARSSFEKLLLSALKIYVSNLICYQIISYPHENWSCKNTPKRHGFPTNKGKCYSGISFVTVCFYILYEKDKTALALAVNFETILLLTLLNKLIKNRSMVNYVIPRKEKNSIYLTPLTVILVPKWC